MNPRRLLAFLFAVVALTLEAQTVRWDPPSGTLAFNRTSQISLVFENCEPDLQGLKLPDVDGLSFGRPDVSTSSSTQIVIGGGGSSSITRTYQMNYPVRAARRGTIEIPAFSVPTDKGAITVRAASYSVTDAPASRGGIAMEDIMSTSLDSPRNTYWEGEPFPVNFSFSVVRRYFNSPASKVNWDPAPLIAEEWGQPQPSESLVKGERRMVVTFATRAYGKKAGTFELKPATMYVNMIVGYVGFGPFSQQQVETIEATTKPLDVTIQPLPPAPPGFTGIVGNFTLNSKVVPTTPAVGEPVTWTLELSGVGNWPDIGGLPAREVSNDFQVIQPKSKRTMKDGSLFEGTLSEDVVLVPNRMGTYTLGPVKLTYFDTRSGEYRTITTDPVTLTVGAAGTAGSSAATNGGPVQFSLNPPALPSAPAAAVAPPAPESLPRDAIPGPRHGIVPFTQRGVAVFCLAAGIAFPLATWLVFAALRSRETDPRRRRREALANLGRILADLRANPSAATTYLRQWQEQTTALWEIPHAAPAAALVHAIVTTHSRDGSATWAALWSEADRALHGRNAPLPSDWIVRAQGALQAVRVPEWPPASTFHPRNLLPFLLVLALLAPTRGRGDEGGEAYGRADFAAAETAWRGRIAAAPADWAARHNLGLALAQQDRWGEAAAEFSGAFLLAPRSDATRWDLALSLQKSSLAPPGLVELGRGHGKFAIARLASPGEWQVVLICASTLIAVALVVLLFRGYRGIGTWARPAALGAILVAILVAGSATISLGAYGQLTNPDVALVWKPTQLRSIPTEADSTQKMSALAAGSIAVADRQFLGGWSHLVFPGGQTGWVRTEDIVRLYR